MHNGFYLSGHGAIILWWCYYFPLLLWVDGGGSMTVCVLTEIDLLQKGFALLWVVDFFSKAYGEIPVG